MRATLRTAGTVAFSVVFLLVAPAARADAGPRPAIAPAKVEIDEAVGQGADIRLPSLSVLNRGDAAGTFSLMVTGLSNQDELSADGTWFKFDPQQFTIDAGAGQVVNVRLRVPVDATIGRYRALLEASAGDAGASGVTVGVAVASTVIFEVKDANPMPWDPAVRWVQARAPYSYAGFGLLAGLAGFHLFRQRFRLRISFGVDRKDR